MNKALVSTMKTIAAPADLAEAVRYGGSRGRRLARYVVLLAVLGAIILGWIRYRSGGGQPQSVLYVSEPVQRGDISVSVTATGNLEPTNEVTIGSELSGTVEEVYVDTNDRVTKGQPLAKLDISKLLQSTEISRASLNSAKAKVLQAEATVRESEATLLRQQDLHRISGGKMPSKSELDAAEAAADRAKADLVSVKASVLQSEAQLKSNETDLQKAVIKSPIDGVVLTRSIEPGQTMAASFNAPELFILAESLEQMKLKVSVAEMDIGRVEPGQKATFTVDAWPDRTFRATVKKVSFGSKVVDNVVTYETLLEVSNQDLSLRPGMTAVVDIKVAEKSNVLLVSNIALRFDPEAEPAMIGPGPSGRKSFVQSLMPGPPRSGGQRPSTSLDAPSKLERGAKKESRVWILQSGTPAPVAVEKGLTDGRRTEVSGEGLHQDMRVIVRAKTPVP